jgi:predicted transcriptional regulator
VNLRLSNMTPADLTRRRTALGLSQGQLAQRLRVTRVSVCKWENGHMTKGVPRWVKYALDELEATSPKPARLIASDAHLWEHEDETWQS